MRSAFILPLTGVLLTLLTQGCGSSAPRRDVYDMGEKVRVGTLTYNVIETAWKSQLGEYPSSRLPDRNFLLIRVSVTNGGGGERTVPALSIENANGDAFTESPNGQGVDGWFGLIRRLAPAATDEGWILFDVPTNSYRLRVVDTDADGTEKVALINIPLRLSEN